MKRVYVAIALLLVVVAIAYIKSARGTARQREAFEQGQAQSGQKLAALQVSVDSLKQLLKLQAEAYADSLTSRDGAYRQDISRLIGFLDTAIARPQSRNKPPSSSPKTVKPKPPVEPKTGSEKATINPPAKESEPVSPSESSDSKSPDKAKPKDEAVDPALKEKVLTHYGKLYDELPKDLTSQERKVALYEISLKTAAEFSITMPQLKAVCENYYLSY